MKLGRLNQICIATPFTSSFVTPAKAGVQLLRVKFNRQGMDSRLRGNDEFGGGEASL
jgi:hypothetical protein